MRQLAAMLLLAAAGACGGNAPTRAAQQPTAADELASASAKKHLPLDIVTPSLLVPQLGRTPLEPLASERDVQHLLLGGLRISRTAGGDVSRSRERFPSGAVRATRLPAHLGGGFLFHQTDSQGTRLWRAAGWTTPLKPLIQLTITTKEVIVGFDRVYLRSQHGWLVAVDVDSGRIVALGNLPLGAAYGAMVFADGWRALVDVDLRGTMATFDAGSSWFRVPLTEAPYAAAVTAGDPTVYTHSGAYRLDAEGRFRPLATHKTANSDDTPTPARAHHPLGPHPLRTAIEHGQPTADGSVVVAHAGALVRVSLPGAKVLGLNPDAFEDKLAECTAVRIADGFGFVCGAAARETIIYAYRPPLGVQVMARFGTPRFVSSSGNGALVVRGACGDEKDAPAAASMLNYCIIGVDGSMNEIAVSGEIGAERVVALRDGRSVVLVPPRLERPGRITVIDGNDINSHVLRYPKKPKAALAAARTGLWLRGFQQRGDDRIGGWVEAGGPSIGVEVSLDGEVTMGELYDDGGSMLLSGRFALAVNDTEGGRESLDGGMSWNSIELPQLPNSLDYPRRSCSAVGCSLKGWARLGWGKNSHEDDLQTAKTPASDAHPGRLPAAAAMVCRLLGQANKPAPATQRRTGASSRSWPAHLREPAPPLGDNMVGVSKGTGAHDPVPARVYVWGPKGADWTRAGWWTIRLNDRFAAPGVLSSAATRSLWSDANTAADAIGSRYRGTYWSWNAEMDPAGNAAVITVCTGPLCKPFGVVAGRPIQPLRSHTTSELPNPIDHGVVRLGESWYILGHPPRQAGDIKLYRSSLGYLEMVAALRRLPEQIFSHRVTPKLVRTVHTGKLGLLQRIPPNRATGERVGRFIVLPLDPTDGAIGQPIDLGAVHLTAPIRRCAPQDRGWRANITTDLAPVIKLENTHGRVNQIELRVRMTPYSRCLEAMAGSTARSFRTSDGGREKQPFGRNRKPPQRTGVPLVVRNQYSNERWTLDCRGR